MQQSKRHFLFPSLSMCQLAVLLVITSLVEAGEGAKRKGHVLSAWTHYTYHCNDDDLTGLEKILAVEMTGFPTPPNGTSCCSQQDWPGISCTLDGRVKSVRVSGLCGSLPSDFPDSLHRMTELKLGPSTCITGTLPPEWAHAMRLLQILDLSQTAVGGPLPEEWGNMTSLEYLGLFQTSIEGTVPRGWGHLRNLKTLDLSLTSISGTLHAGHV